MIDSHCHLDHEPLFGDLDNIIKRSQNIGIKTLLTISTSFESFSKGSFLTSNPDFFKLSLIFFSSPMNEINH